MDKENTNQNITPVFWDENDGKWHFTEKCLSQNSRLHTSQTRVRLKRRMRRCRLIWKRRRNF